MCVWVRGCGCGCVNVCMWAYVGVYVCITGVGGSKKRAFRISSIYWGKLVPQGNNNRNTKNTKNFLTRSWLYTGMNISETPPWSRFSKLNFPSWRDFSPIIMTIQDWGTDKCVSVCVCACLWVKVCGCMHVCVGAGMRVWVCECVHVGVCGCVWVYSHKNRVVAKQT